MFSLERMEAEGQRQPTANDGALPELITARVIVFWGRLHQLDATVFYKMIGQLADSKVGQALATVCAARYPGDP